MKRRWVIVLVVWACAISSHAQRLDFKKLPGPVQSTINERKGPDRIKRIEFAARNGIAAYEVEFQRRGFNPRLIVSPDGSVIEDHRVRVPTPKDEQGLKWDLPDLGAKSVTWKKLPLPVRKRIDQESHGRTIARIKSKPHGGQIVFITEYRQRGKNERLIIAEDGSLLAEQVASQTSASPPVLGAPSGAQTDTSAIRRLQFKDAPLEVQNTVNAHGGTANLLEAEQSTSGGKTVFRALVNENGKLKTIQISEDGAVID